MRDNLEVNLRKGKITGNWSHRETGADPEKRGGYRRGMRNRNESLHRQEQRLNTELR